MLLLPLHLNHAIRPNKHWKRAATLERGHLTWLFVCVQLISDPDQKPWFARNGLRSRLDRSQMDAEPGLRIKRINWILNQCVPKKAKWSAAHLVLGDDKRINTQIYTQSACVCVRTVSSAYKVLNTTEWNLPSVEFTSGLLLYAFDYCASPLYFGSRTVVVWSAFASFWKINEDTTLTFARKRT